uniref:Uncharacterized protein n=1 Tax=Arundo donax TaxID=35708 RepID=A0A0A9EUS5_ARUDO
MDLKECTKKLLLDELVSVLGPVWQSSRFGFSVRIR